MESHMLSSYTRPVKCLAGGKSQLLFSHLNITHLLCLNFSSENYNKKQQSLRSLLCNVCLLYKVLCVLLCLFPVLSSISIPVVCAIRFYKIVDHHIELLDFTLHRKVCSQKFLTYSCCLCFNITYKKKIIPTDNSFSNTIVTPSQYK